MNSYIVSGLGLLLLVSSPSPASAQEAGLPGDPTLATGFVTLDRVGVQSNAGVAAGLSLYDEGVADYGLRFDLYGQYVAPEGWGVYGMIPIAFVSSEDDSESAAGNFDVGGTYTLSGSVPVVLRGGLFLPTADEDLEGQITNIYTIFGRLTDLASASSETTWLRMSASPISYSGQIFVRFDGGIDLPIDSPDGVDDDPLARINVGAGVDIGTAALTGELISVGTLGDVADDEDRFIHTFAVSARGTGGVQPYGAIVIPIDDEVRDGINLIVTVGVQSNLSQ